MRFRSVVMTIAPVVRFSQEVEAIRLRREWSDSRRGKQYDAARSASFNYGVQATAYSLRYAALRSGFQPRLTPSVRRLRMRISPIVVTLKRTPERYPIA